MHGRKGRRLALVAVVGLALGLAGGLTLYALGDRFSYNATPSELALGTHAAGTRVRLGGLVEAGSVKKGEGGHVAFSVTDTAHSVPVTYVGLLPDLFREGQGVVTEGVVDPDGTLRADTVFARHDENYMPKEVVDALKAEGRWQEGGGAPAARATAPEPGGAGG